MGATLLLFLLIQIYLPSICMAKTDKIFCYYESIAAYRPGNGKFQVQDIDPILCTHLIYGFLGIDKITGNFEILNYFGDIMQNGLENFLKLKLKNPAIKSLISIGGSTEETFDFNHVISDKFLKENFIKSLKEFLGKFKFDGFDIYIDGPADKNSFTGFLKDLRENIKEIQILTVAVTHQVYETYDIPEISKYIDYYIVKAYDYHTTEDGYLGYNAPLDTGPSDETNYLRLLNIKYSLLMWSSVLISSYQNEISTISRKIILGIPLFGTSYQLPKSKEHTVGSLSSGKGKPGPYSKTDGYLSYLEICQKVATENFIIAFDEVQSSRYAYNDQDWISYDDVETVKLKVLLAIKKDLGGLAVYPISNDDPRNICSKETFPMTRTIKRVMSDYL